MPPRWGGITVADFGGSGGRRTQIWWGAGEKIFRTSRVNVKMFTKRSIVVGFKRKEDCRIQGSE